MAVSANIVPTSFGTETDSSIIGQARINSAVGLLISLSMPMLRRLSDHVHSYQRLPVGSSIHQRAGKEPELIAWASAIEDLVHHVDGDLHLTATNSCPRAFPRRSPCYPNSRAADEKFLGTLVDLQATPIEQESNSNLWTILRINNSLLLQGFLRMISTSPPDIIRFMSDKSACPRIMGIPKV